MSSWQLLTRGCLGLALILVGCDAPEEIMPTSPPGTVLPRTAPDSKDPAQAQGESAVIAPKASGESGKASTHPHFPRPRE